MSTNKSHVSTAAWALAAWLATPVGWASAQQEPPAEPNVESPSPPAAEGYDGAPESAQEEVIDIDGAPTAASSGTHLSMSIGAGEPITVRTLGIYELHFNVISDDYSGNDWLSFYMVKATADLTKKDQIAVRMDLEQRFVADPGENGLWFGDIRFYYSRKFEVPIPEFPIPGKGSLWLTAPTSRQSRERSYITKPTAEVTLVPSLGPVALYTTGYFQYAAAQYAESGHGGHPNTLFSTGYQLQLVWTPLSWFAPSATWYQAFDKPYRSREGTRQSWRPYYYYEVAANFSVPTPPQAPTVDLMLAFAQGANLLEEGVYRAYIAKRDQAEIYFGLNLTY